MIENSSGLQAQSGSMLSQEDQIEHKGPVEVIAEGLYEDMMNGSVNPLENARFYEFFSSLSDEDKSKILERFDEKPSEYTSRITKEVDQRFAICGIHPGVAVRIDSFIPFLKQELEKNYEITPLQAILDFSQQLGDVVLYRGITLNSEELAEIKSNGMFPSALKTKEDAITTIQTLIDPESKTYYQLLWNLGKSKMRCATSFIGDIIGRLSDLGRTEKSINMSASEFPEVAATVGWHSSGRKGEKDVKPYLARIKIPLLHTYNSKILGSDAVRGSRKVDIDGKIFEGEGVEYFIPLAVLPNEIESIEQIEEPPTHRVIYG